MQSDPKRVLNLLRRRTLPVLGALAILASCAYTSAGDQSGSPSAMPSTSVQREVAAPLAVFAPAESAQMRPQPPVVAATDAPPIIGLAGISQAQTNPGNASRGRDFAFDNCRPCHVVAPNQPSTTRFSNAPDFRAIANMPTTTSLSLVVWLTNPHPTMPSLVLSAQEAADVIAYIQSLRDRS